MIEKFFRWFSGGQNQYMDLVHCLNYDHIWVWIIVSLCTSVIVGYIVIAYHWYSNLRTLKKGLSKSSLFNMVNIFLFCGICGYLFPIMKMWWPAWRLQAIFLTVLAYFTWRYALNTPKLKVIYEEIHRAGELTTALEHQKEVTNALVEIVEHDLAKPVQKASEVLKQGIINTDNERVRAILARALINVEEAARKTDEAKAVVDKSNNGTV